MYLGGTPNLSTPLKTWQISTPTTKHGILIPELISPPTPPLNHRSPDIVQSPGPLLTLPTPVPASLLTQRIQGFDPTRPPPPVHGATASMCGTGAKPATAAAGATSATAAPAATGTNIATSATAGTGANLATSAYAATGANLATSVRMIEDRNCYRCEKRGHIARDCPKKDW